MFENFVGKTRDGVPISKSKKFPKIAERELWLIVSELDYDCGRWRRGDVLDVSYR